MKNSKIFLLHFRGQITCIQEHISYHMHHDLEISIAITTTEDFILSIIPTEQYIIFADKTKPNFQKKNNLPKLTKNLPGEAIFTSIYISELHVYNEFWSYPSTLMISTMSLSFSLATSQDSTILDPFLEMNRNFPITMFVMVVPLLLLKMNTLDCI